MSPGRGDHHGWGALLLLVLVGLPAAAIGLACAGFLVAWSMQPSDSKCAPPADVPILIGGFCLLVATATVLEYIRAVRAP